MKQFLYLLFIIIFGFESVAQVSVTNAAPTATIDFSASMQTTVGYGAFTGAGFSPASITGRLNSNAWETKGWENGDLLFGAAMTNPAHARGSVASGVVTEGIYAFTETPGTVANPAMLIQPAADNFQPGTIALRIKNNGTSNMTQLEISYNIFFRNDEDSSISFNFSHSADNVAYQPVSALDFTTPTTSDPLQWQLVDVSPSRSMIISGLNVAPGGFYYIRWSSGFVSGVGASDELGLDDIVVKATYGAPAPEINVTGNNLSILTGDMTPQVPDGTQFANTFTGGSQSIIEYKIQNLGGLTLTVSNVTITGVNPGDFTVQIPSSLLSPIGTVAPVNGATISARSLFIRFSPLAPGTRTAIINIFSDDADENPYQYRVEGLGVVPQPDIDLNGNTGGTSAIYSTNMIPVTTNNTLFSPQVVGGAGQIKDYKIKNNGTASILVLTNPSPYVTIGGANPGDFTLVAIPSGPTLYAGFTKTFSIRFNPTAAGIRTAIVSIANNDIIPDVFGNPENPFTFMIQGTGVAPEIDITGNAQPIISGSTVPSFTNHTYFDNLNTTTGVLDRTYTIKNTGTVALAVGAITITGSSAFTLLTPPAASVAPNTSTTFKIRFAPTTLGAHSATVSIVNDDFDENPYTFVVGGFGVDYIPCTYDPTETIVMQDFETTPATPTWSYTSSNTTLTTANAFGITGDSGSSNRFLGARAIQVSNASGVITMAGVNTLQYSNVELNLRVSSMSANATDGNDSSDKVVVAVSSNGGATWSNEIEISGTTDSKWTYASGTGLATRSYLGNNVSSIFIAPSGFATTTGYGTLSITGLPSVANLIVRITANNNAANEIWAIDNIMLFGRKEISTTWSGGSWTNGAPTSSVKAIIDGNYDTAVQGNLQACKCEIKAGRNVTIQPNQFFNIQSDFVNLGNITIENNGSLVQRNDFAVNSGIINVKRYSTPMTRFDYTYWSSPVIGQTLFNFSPLTLSDKFFTFNPPIGNWQNVPSSTVMAPGQGYLIRAPQTFSTTVPAVYNSGVFGGLANNGYIQVAISGGAGAWNLIGNPYSSSISANMFLTSPSNSGVIGGTIYFWTHNTPVANNIYSSNDYASYNLTGGVGTAAANSGVNNTVPTGNIASGQGFFVKALTNGQVTFNNSMRQTTSNAEFFRSSDIGLATAIPFEDLERHRIWLNLTNDQGAYKQTLVGYVSGATNDLDRSFDGNVIEAGNPISLYSIVQSDKLTIQGRALPFSISDIVKLGYSSSIDGTFSIGLEQFDGIMESVNIFLEDHELGIIHDLKASPYSFSTGVGTFDNRFDVRFTDSALGINNPGANGSGVIVTVKDKKIGVSSPAEAIQSIAVYDLLGRMITEVKAINSNNFTSVTISSATQTMVVKITLQNGTVVNRKIVL